MADPESAVSGEVASGSADDKAAAHKRERFAGFRAWRASIRDRPHANLVYRLSVAVVGAVVTYLVWPTSKSAWVAPVVGPREAGLGMGGRARDVPP